MFLFSVLNFKEYIHEYATLLKLRFFFDYFRALQKVLLFCKRPTTCVALDFLFPFIFLLPPPQPPPTPTQSVNKPESVIIGS